jgi:tetratricopeptide (TPR) repeat protein
VLLCRKHTRALHVDAVRSANVISRFGYDAIMRAVILSIIMSSLLPTVAHATSGDKAKARELYRVGTQHYNLAEYDQALDAFKEAYREFEDPIFLFNIGQCHRQLGHKQEAIGFYRGYLRNEPTASNRDEVNALIAKLEASIVEDNAAKQIPSANPATPSQGPPAAMTVPQFIAASSPQAAVENPARPAPQAARTPVYKRWWLWTVVGVVAAGAAVGAAVAITQAVPASPAVPTELGNYRF